MHSTILSNMKNNMYILIRGAKKYSFLFCIVFLVVGIIIPFRDIMQKYMYQPVNVLEPFIVICNSTVGTLVIPIAFILLVSDFPRTDKGSLFRLMRIGRINWFLSESLFMFLCGQCLLISILLISIYFNRNGFLYNAYSGCYEYINNVYPNERIQNGLAITVDERLYSHYKPYEAVILNYILISLMLLMYVLIIVCSYLFHKKIIGLFICIIISLTGYICEFWNSNIRWFFPFSNASLASHYDLMYRIPLWSVTASILYFVSLIVILYFIINKQLTKYSIYDMED